MPVRMARPYNVCPYGVLAKRMSIWRARTTNDHMVRTCAACAFIARIRARFRLSDGADWKGGELCVFA